ncbi:hypothetical protein, partial [Alkalibacillus haloalkaliphilus]|uniref:hypothetical protein n=1 Tax=Alkalibacillus haloalkaliphilus TaxID=94136 RepID=UPI0029365AF3
CGTTGGVLLRGAGGSKMNERAKHQRFYIEKQCNTRCVHRPLFYQTWSKQYTWPRENKMTVQQFPKQIL